MRKILLSFIASLMIISSVQAAKKVKTDFYKFNRLKFNLSPENITSSVDSEQNLINVDLLISEEDGSAEVNYKFSASVDDIKKGKVFKLNSGDLVEQGKVNVNGAVDTVVEGADATVRSDSETKIKGRLKVISVDGNTFVFIMKAKAKNLLVDFPGVSDSNDPRLKRKVKIKARVTAALPN